MVDVDEIDSAQQTFTANLFFMARWQDPRLAHSGEGEVWYPLDAAWHPRLQIVSEQRSWWSFPRAVQVSPDGEVVCRQRIWGQFSQPLDLSDFPFDRHRFTIQLVAVGVRAFWL